MASQAWTREGRVEHRPLQKGSVQQASLKDEATEEAGGKGGQSRITDAREVEPLMRGLVIRPHFTGGPSTMQTGSTHLLL